MLLVWPLFTAIFLFSLTSMKLFFSIREHRRELRLMKKKFIGREFVRGLFTTYGDSLRELEVRRASLEETYLALVRAS